MYVVEKETPIYEVFQPSLNLPFPPIHDINTTSNIIMDNVNDAEVDESKQNCMIQSSSL